jgi:hypothetical protein
LLANEKIASEMTKTLADHVALVHHMPVVNAQVKALVE